MDNYWASSFLGTCHALLEYIFEFRFTFGAPTSNFCELGIYLEGGPCTFLGFHQWTTTGRHLSGDVSRSAGLTFRILNYPRNLAYFSGREFFTLRGVSFSPVLYLERIVREARTFSVWDLDQWCVPECSTHCPAHAGVKLNFLKSARSLCTGFFEFSFGS